MEENGEKLLSNFNAASTNIRRSLGGKGGEAAEKVYGQTYQALVRIGLKPQLRKKYR